MVLILGFFLVVMPLGIGGLMMYAVLRDIVRGFRARRWPTTSGRILSVLRKMDSSSSFPSDSSGSKTERVSAQYLYIMDGREYRGETIHPLYQGGGFKREQTSLEEVLRPNRLVLVYVDPARFDQSMLAPGFYSGTLTFALMGLFFFVVGIYALWGGLGGGLLWEPNRFVFGMFAIAVVALLGDWGFARRITILPQEEKR